MNCSGMMKPPSMRFSNSNLSIVVTYGLVFVLAFIGNVGMFLILFRNQCIKKRRVHSLLLHMTIAHLLVTLIYIPKEIVHNITVAWLGGDLLCRLCKFFDVFGVALSAGILVCLSLDRFYSILFPLYSISAKRSVQRMIIAAWLLSFASSLPQIYIFRTATHPCFPEFTQCVSADVIHLISPKVTFWFSILNILQVYFLPLMVILVCYSSILISISLKSGAFKKANGTPTSLPAKNTTTLLNNNKVVNKTVNGNQNGVSITIPSTKSLETDGLRRSGGTDSYEKAKNRTLIMTIVLVLAFLLCWTPYTIAMFFHFLKASTSERPISPLLSKFLYAFAVFNSAISPYLYGYFSFNIREECRRLTRLFLRAPCLTGGSSLESLTASRSRSPHTINSALNTDARRKAMIRRQSRTPDTTIATASVTNSSVRFKHQPQYSTRRSSKPRLSETSRTLSLNLAMVSGNKSGTAIIATSGPVSAARANARNNATSATVTFDEGGERTSLLLDKRQENHNGDDGAQPPPPLRSSRKGSEKRIAFISNNTKQRVLDFDSDHQSASCDV